MLKRILDYGMSPNDDLGRVLSCEILYGFDIDWDYLEAIGYTSFDQASVDNYFAQLLVELDSAIDGLVAIKNHLKIH